MESAFLTQYVAVLLFLLNAWSFGLMWWDKRQARRRGRRIRESTFFLLALLGGGGGVWLGMSAWRHKTQHASFRFGIPALLIAWIVCLLVMGSNS